MQLGFLTACLGSLDLRTIVSWAGSHGFTAVEVSAWEAADPRALNPAHLDVRTLRATQARDLSEQLAEVGVAISALAYYENNLHGDHGRRARIHDHLRACVDAAALLGVPVVGTFIGRDIGNTVARNLAEAERVVPPLIEYAAERGVQLMVENCPMTGWHPDGYPANLAYSPELWEWLAGLGLRLNFDPSHLVGLGIDPTRALRSAAGLVVHVHAKDIEILDGKLDHFGYLGRAVDRRDPWDHAWWRYCLPGRGVIDWLSIVAALRDSGYAGVLSIEHEDPVSSDSIEDVQRGLLTARAFLTPLLAGPIPD